MERKRVHRRLAAILAADVVGYSRLMGADEVGTRSRFNAHLSEFIQPMIAEYQGRIIKEMGDGLLVEFASVIDAIQCAVNIQDGIRDRNIDNDPNQRIEFRVGVNQGDVIVERDDIHGDGVNIAARLESLAEPGGVVISGKVYEEVRGKLDFGFEDLGLQEVKNIAEPVKAFRIAMASSVPKSAFAVPQTPDKPSIAILPFENMSGDREQEYFSDGITEDVITALSRVRWFRVVARNSSFSYKGQSADVRTVAKNLGVRYVIEGSVRKAGARIRLTAQLIDGASGDHLWAQRYDRNLEDIFELQDELTQTIVGAIEPELGRAERERAKRVHSENLQAWDTYQRAMWHYHKRGKQDYAEADRFFRQAIEEDPNLTRAYSGLAHCLSMSAILGYAGLPRARFDEAVTLARRAIEIDPQDADARVALARAYGLSREPEKACVEAEAAIKLDPNYGAAYYHLGSPLVALGKFEDGIKQLETAIRLSPHDPLLGQFYARMAQAHLFMKNYEKAADWAGQALRQPGALWPMAVFKASALGHLGNANGAADAIREIYRLHPEFTEQKMRELFAVGESAAQDHIFDGLRKAGWEG